jgi:integrase
VEFGSAPLRSIRRSHVEQWVKGMSARGLAPGTVTTRFNNVRAVFRAAVRDRLIATDPSDGVALPRRRRAEAALVVPTAAQVGKLMAAAEAPFRPMLALAAFAGLRVGEVCGLQVGDVEFLPRQLQVRRQVQRVVGAGVEIRPPKFGSERVAFLHQDLLEILAAHVATRPGDDPARWLFEGERGNPPHQNTVTYYWSKAKGAAGVSGLRLHDMRHFFASGLIFEGCDVVTVSRALGHANPATTLRVYAHLWPTAEDRTRAASGRLLMAALGTAADPLRTTEGREVR